MPLIEYTGNEHHRRVKGCSAGSWDSCKKGTSVIPWHCLYIQELVLLELVGKGRCEAHV